MRDLVVIGAGLAGLVAAIRAARAGRGVTLLTFGTGGLTLSQGTVDVLGYSPGLVERPLAELDAFAASRPEHPYARLGSDAVRTGVEYLTELAGPDLLTPHAGEANLLLPTAVGAVRPTWVAPPSMQAAQVRDGVRFAVVGFAQHKDFHPALCAANLARTALADVAARPITLDLPARQGEVDASALTYARAFDDPEFRRRFVAALRPRLAKGETVLVPAMLGLADVTAWASVADELGHPLAEIPLPPPSVPGIRLNDRLLGLAQQAGVRIMRGSRVTAARTEGGRVTGVVLAAAGRDRLIEAAQYLYAPGGFESGALHLDSYGAVTERVFGLPLHGLTDGLVTGDDPAQQPLFKVGVATDAAMRPVDAAGAVVLANLRVAGGLLAGAVRWSEKSGEGIAVGSAVVAADSICEDQR